jgi:DNA-binding GntR family transcriptional regulator
VTARVGDGYRPLRDVVCDAIRDQIMNGRHLPGARLVEDRLAVELGVSRNPVREALRVLEAEGYVEMIPRRGAVVASMSDKEVEDIFEVRLALEALAARLAARRADATSQAALKKILAETRTALRRSEPAKLAALNTRFHELVVDVADNGYLRDVMLPLRGRMQWIFSRTVGQRAGHSLDEHFEMADAIVQHDEERAAKLAESHIEAARQSYVEDTQAHLKDRRGLSAGRTS